MRITYLLGFFEWGDGDLFSGVWKNGGRIGNGKLILKNGEIIDQVWHELPHQNYSSKIPSKFPHENDTNELPMENIQN